MKMKTSLILIFLSVISLSFSQDLFVSENNDGKWGFVNLDGEVVIKHQYEKADCFYMGYASVVLMGKMGLIDLKGNIIIPFEYDNDLMYFEDGLAVVKKRDKYGYANLDGEIVIPILYDEAKDCSNGKCEVRKDERWMILDKYGQEIIK